MIFARLYHLGQPVSGADSIVHLNHRMTMEGMTTKVSKAAEKLRWNGVHSDGFKILKGKSLDSTTPLFSNKIHPFTQAGG